MQILITGATGVVGTYTTIALKELGWDVVATGRRKDVNGFFRGYDIPYFNLNIVDHAVFQDLKNFNITAIIHLAVIQPAAMIGYYPQAYIDTILTGTLNVLQFAAENKISKIIFAQTRADSNHLLGSKVPIPSDIVRTFPKKGDHAIYAICKNAAVDLLEHFYQQYGINYYALRLPTIYGYHPNSYYNVDGAKRKMAYRLLIEKAIMSLPIEIWGDPKQEKEIVYIKDLIQIIQKSLEHRGQGGIFNVGRGVGVTLDEQIRGIVEVFSPKVRPSELIYRPDKSNARQFVHDISKTRNELGYEPQFHYKALLEDFKYEMGINRFEKLWGTSKDYE